MEPKLFTIEQNLLNDCLVTILVLLWKNTPFEIEQNNYKMSKTYNDHPFAPFDIPTLHQRKTLIESQRSIHLAESADVPFEHSKIKRIVEVAEKRGAKRGLDYIVVLREIVPCYRLITFYSTNAFISPKEDFFWFAFTITLNHAEFLSSVTVLDNMSSSFKIKTYPSNRIIDKIDWKTKNQAW